MWTKRLPSVPSGETDGARVKEDRRHGVDAGERWQENEPIKGNEGQKLQGALKTRAWERQVFVEFSHSTA